jgi:flavorubredoxin
MGITNTQSGTRIDEIAENTYRITTPVQIPNMGGFSFNQYLVVDDEPLLFHTGPRKMFELVKQAVASVMPVERLRHISFSHVEADECGSLNEWLAAAPGAAPLCGAFAAMLQVGDLADREPRGLPDGEGIAIGSGRRVRWFDTPHLPHGWECGYLFDEKSKTLFCGDLFTQAGADNVPITESDILGPSEGMRKAMDYYAHAPNSRALIEKLAANSPRVLACMHGSAWRGDGAALLRTLADTLSPG